MATAQVDDEPEAPSRPTARSLVAGFLAGAVVIGAWSGIQHHWGPDRSEQLAVQQCNRQLSDRVGHAVGLRFVEATQDGGAWTVTGLYGGRTYECRIRLGELSGT
jgi:hypothetical protein